MGLGNGERAIEGRRDTEFSRHVELEVCKRIPNADAHRGSGEKCGWEVVILKSMACNC